MSGPRSHVCEECSKAYTRKDHLKGHMRVHTGERPYECTECDAAFAYQQVLANHMKLHTGEKSYKCTECDRSFSFSHHLDYHLRTHTGEKPYKCTDCDGAFASQVNLTVHMRIHTGEKPYKCPECNATFSQSGSLTEHMKIHTGTRIYKCTICESTFTHKHTLVNHIRTHTGEKPYKCTECDYSAAIKSNTKEHFRRMHTLEGLKIRNNEEAKIETLFNEKYPQAFIREHRIDHKCLKMLNSHSRIDFLFPNHGKVHVAFEVDEYQHREYSQVCETSRMNNIVSSLRLGGDETPIVFVRYNPHSFKVDGATKRTARDERYTKVCELLDKIKAMEHGEHIHVFYMFYDTVSELPVVLTDPEYFDAVKEWFAGNIV